MASSTPGPSEAEAAGGGSPFLESLIQSLLAVSEPDDPAKALERTRAEGKTLFRASAATILPREDTPVADVRVTDDGVRVPLRDGDEEIGTLALARDEPFTDAEVSRATTFAAFAARAIRTARLVAQTKAREEERARLTERLVTAEQDERRRLSIFLHDGPLQSMSGIALMHDAALAAIRDGRYDDAASVIESSLERERATIRTLRDLSFAIEPIVLRDQGFSAAVRALGEQMERAEGIRVSVDVSVGERLAEKAQVALYQLIREALQQAVRRRPNRVAVSMSEEDGGFALEIRDDGMDERRQGVVAELGERVHVLNGNVVLESVAEGGTAIRVALPSYARSAPTAGRAAEDDAEAEADSGGAPG